MHVLAVGRLVARGGHTSILSHTFFTCKHSTGFVVNRNCTVKRSGFGTIPSRHLRGRHQIQNYDLVKFVKFVIEYSIHESDVLW